MEWIKTEEGYVRSDCISGVYIDKYAPDVINLILNSDHVVVFKQYDFEDREEATKTMDKLVEHLAYTDASIASEIMMKLP